MKIKNKSYTETDGCWKCWRTELHLCAHFYKTELLPLRFRL